MSKSLHTAILQMNIEWEQKKRNQAYIDIMLRKLPADVDLVVLPEMFTTGFSMNAHALAESMEGDTIGWMNQITAQANFALCGSIIVEEKGRYYNRFVWSGGGQIKAWYDKRHLFTMAGEHKIYSPGTSSVTIGFRGWRILPRVCYDLRFPVWNRTTDCDLQIYVANWPKPRTNAWESLLYARAIENQCYLIGVNRIGMDGNGHDYVGSSMAIDPKGSVITPDKWSGSGWIFARLDKDDLTAYRAKFPVYLDADEFDLREV